MICSCVLESYEPTLDHNDSHWLRKITSKLQRSNRALLNISVVHSICILAWSMMDIREGFQPPPLGLPPLNNDEIPWWLWPRVSNVIFDYLLVGIEVGCSIMFAQSILSIVRYLWSAYANVSKMHRLRVGRGRRPPYDGIVWAAMPFPCIVLLLWILWSVDKMKGFGIDCCFSTLAVSGLLMRQNMNHVGMRFPKVARSILITWPDASSNGMHDEDIRFLDEVTFRCFISFVYTTVVCVVWYAYRYNPEGTVNKSWTGVFG